MFYANKSHFWLLSRIGLRRDIVKEEFAKSKSQWAGPDEVWIHFSSGAQLCPTHCNPMNRSMPGLPVHHHLPEFTQTHIHRVHDAIQPSHPRSSPSLPAPNPSQHQSLFKWVNFFAWGGQSTGGSALASFLPKNSQGWSPSEWTGWISLQFKGLSRVFSTSQFKGINYLLSAFFTVQLSHPYMTTRKTIALTWWTFVGKVMPLFWICYLGWS